MTGTMVALALAALLVGGCDLPGRSAEPEPTVYVQAYQPGAAAPANASQTATPSPAETPFAAAIGLAAPVSAASSDDGRLGYTGEVLAIDQVRMAPEVAGAVLKVNAEVGDHVQAGDPLLQIDSTSLEAQRAQALAGLEAAQSQLDLLTIEPKDADLEAARAGVAAADAAYKRALEGQTEEDPATIAQAYAVLASSRAQLQRLEDGPEDAEIRAGEAQVRQAEAALYLAQLQLDNTVLRAPMDGVVASVDTSVGARVGPESPVLSLLSEGVEIAIPVEEFRLAELRVGQPAVIRVDAYADRTAEGAIAIIAPQVDATTRTVRVIIRPSGDATWLAPGMLARVELLE